MTNATTHETPLDDGTTLLDYMLEPEADNTNPGIPVQLVAFCDKDKRDRLGIAIENGDLELLVNVTPEEITPWAQWILDHASTITGRNAA